MLDGRVSELHISQQGIDIFQVCVHLFRFCSVNAAQIFDNVGVELNELVRRFGLSQIYLEIRVRLLEQLLSAFYVIVRNALVELTI